MTDAEPNNPLGLNLDFLFGRGYLWAKGERLSDWITLEHLRMEIPDLTFPFDARGGLHRFRNTRSLVREIEMSTSEVGLGDLLREAATDIDGFEDVDVHFLDGAVHVSTRVRTLGSDTFLSFRAALIPPEPARADEVHLSLYDYRAFGPLPYPARLLAFELMTRLLNTPLLRPPGRGDSFTVGIAGDILSFRPLKLILLHIFPKVGWKLPNLSDVQLEGTQIRPGALTIRATSLDGKWRPEEKPSFRLTATREGARALAAYEAKDLFANGDQALFDRQPRQAQQLFNGYRDLYGLHPELVARAFDGLLSDPSPGHVAEAESLVRELRRDDPADIQAALAQPTIALLSGRTDAVIEAYDDLSRLLRDRGDRHDWVLCELAASQFLASREPGAAAERLRDVLKVAPRNRTALERLRGLYDQLGETAGLEEVLKRLTGVYTDRQSLTQTYLSLARHLLDREGELGEARIYLERVLRLDPTQFEALNTLGESYVMGGEPLRALRAFGSAARAAESRGDLARAANLLFRVARLWRDEIGDAGQALLAVRRALELGDDADPAKRAEQLAFAARVSQQRERLDEALRYWGEVVPLLEQGLQHARARDQREASESLSERLIDAHRNLAQIYATRDREEAAASHWRRILELEPTDTDSADALAAHYRSYGKPDQLIELYRDLLERSIPLERAVNLRTDLGDLYAQLGMNDEARDAYTEALRIAPTAERARRRLVDLLTGAQRFETLRDALNGLLIRAQDRDTRWSVLLDLGDLQLRHLDQAENAVRTFFEAVQIRPSRLEGLFRTREALEAVAEVKGLDVPSPMGDSTVGGLLLRVLERLAEVAPDDRDRIAVLARLAQVAKKVGDDAAVREAKRRIESLRDVRLDREAVDERLDAIVEDGVGLAESTAHEFDDTSDQAEPLPHRATPEAPPRKQGLPEEAEKLTSFRKRFEEEKKKNAPVPRADEVDPESSIGRVLRRLRSDSEPDSEPDPEVETGAEIDVAHRPNAEDTEKQEATADSPRLVAAREAAQTARRSGDFDAHADALKNLLGLERPGSARALDVQKELGELLYFDLEDADAALPYLEAVRDADPEGRGADPALLNALEAIYEESGRAEGRLAILQERLERAESDEMRTVYRLLIAQLVWEAHEDRAEVELWLGPILERDSRHEAAHRLLADVATDLEDWPAAARHFATVLETSAGGLDAVETERQLATIYLDKIGDPDRALKHFESVLKAAPGDSQALQGFRQAQAATGDWVGFAATLGKELGLLLGRPEGFSPKDIVELDPDAVPDAIRVPASQIAADVAEVVETEIGNTELARQLWGVVVRLWGEHVDALERRIALDRKHDAWADLAHDLEAYADMLLDTHARFDALVECATIHAQQLDSPEAARPLLTEALAMVEGDTKQPDGVDAARRALRALGGN